MVPSKGGQASRCFLLYHNFLFLPSAGNLSLQEQYSFRIVLAKLRASPLAKEKRGARDSLEINFEYS